MKTMKRAAAILLAYMLMAAGSNQFAPVLAALGETFTHQEGGIQFDVPKGWKAEPDGEMLTVTSPSGDLSFVFWVVEEDDFDAAVEALDEELGKVINNMKIVSEPSENKINGMDVVSTSGTGEIEGEKIEWSAELIAAKKAVLVISFAAPGAWEKHGGDIQAFVKSIRRAR